MPYTGQRRPYKFTARRRTKYLELLAEGERRGAAAEQAGVTRQTVMHLRHADPDFQQREEKAEESANERVENALFMAASSGNVSAAQTWLFNRKPAEWRDKRYAEVGGPDGGPIATSIDIRGQVAVYIPDNGRGDRLLGIPEPGAGVFDVTAEPTSNGSELE